jgi:transcription antitermination factor NusG
LQVSTVLNSVNARRAANVVCESARCDSEGEAVGLWPVVRDATSTRASIPHWYAVHTMSRHERLVVHQLGRDGLTVVFPTVTEVRRWTDRTKRVESALFPGYLFVQGIMSSDIRRLVLFARDVVGLITTAGEPVPLPDEQIENAQTLLASRVQCVDYPFVKVGQRVRIRDGVLAGLQGILTGHNGRKGLVVSIEGIQRSLAISIEGYEVEVI